MRWRDVLPLMILSAVGAYAAWAKMQTLLIIVLVLILGLLYRPFVLQFTSLGTRFLTRVDVAKFKDLEIRAEKQIHSLDQVERAQVSIVQHLLLTEMDTQAVSLLVAIGHKGRAPFVGGTLPTVRYLRDRGLVEHDGPTLTESTEVWLSPSGRELVDALTKLRTPAPPAL
jgi:hypothetical protein